MDEMKRRSPWLALLAAMVLALGITSTVSAYKGQVPTTVTVTPSKGTFSCDEYHTVRATVLDQNGLPIDDINVHWSFLISPSSRDRIKPHTSRTNSHGVAKTQVKLACVAGDRTIKARVKNVSGTAVIHVKLRHHHHDTAGGAVLGATSGDPASLPGTSTLPPVVPADSPTVPAIPALFVVLAAGAFILRRVVLTRR
ncbi:MAG: hypothetical protein QOF11_803 [Chloroflexota bacterium]|jgi:hypothetical protein|nr:hypothetical protein [Chloroflexota bacterium]